MSSKPTHDVVATIGKYTDREGNEKKRYVNCGKVFTDEQGRQSIKLDSIPCSPEWSGWLSIYPIRERDDEPRRQAQSQHNQAKSDGYQLQAPW